MCRTLSLIPTAALFSFVVTAQVQSLQPKKVVDLLAAVDKTFGSRDGRIESVAENAGRWAVRWTFSDNQQAILSSPIDREDYAYLYGQYDWIVIDGGGLVILREKGETPGQTVVLEWNPVLKHSWRRTVPYEWALPVISDKTPLWQTEAGLFDTRTNQLRTDRKKAADTAIRNIKDPNVQVNQLVDTVGLPGGRVATFGVSTERITVYGPDGRVESTAIADFAAAYSALGIDYTKHLSEFERIESGKVRAGWVTVSPEGWLLIRLGEVPVDGPAIIAAFDPMKGALVKVLKLELPTSALRRNQWNPRGFISPTFGAYGDRLLIADGLAGVIAIYD